MRQLFLYKSMHLGVDTLLLVDYNVIVNQGREGVNDLEFTVKQARQYAGYTQREMAEKVGVSRDTYRKIEQSPDTATIACAKKISEVVEIPIDQIFFTNDST